MPHIHLTTFIEAPVKRVFDLSRSITLHKKSMAHTNETAIAGTTSGLINKGETVTWQGKHFFKTRQFTSAITEMQSPLMFTDEMTRGDFKSYIHKHHFKQVANGSIMIDVVDFETPYGALGKVANSLFLKKYMEKLLTKRNQVIKEYAESEKWKAILN
jgi:ligand-binding SRPBCC domain-containing protein